MTKSDARQGLLGLRPSLTYMAGLGLAGLVMVLYFHNWTFGATPLFLVFGWWAILASGYFLWTAGLFVAAEGDDSEGFNLFRTRAQDLEVEKDALLKAIKEVEFDHLMGKMSDRDAGQLSAMYRRRAVEILKDLDSELEDDETLTIADRIERDIRARAEVTGAAEQGRARAERHREKRRAKDKARFAAAKRAELPEPPPAASEPAISEEE